MKRWKLLALAGVVGGGRGGSRCELGRPRGAERKASSKAVTLVWWHNANQGAGKALWAQVAKEFHAAHPDVTIKVVPFQNEQFTDEDPDRARSRTTRPTSSRTGAAAGSSTR